MIYQRRTLQAFAPNVLTGRVLASTPARVATTVVAFVAFTAVAAQWRIALPFTPVPITGSTLAVLLAGAALGTRLGSLTMFAYLAVGAIGFPVFTEGASGLNTFLGATGGYLVGFIVAAAAVGAMAERRHDRKMITAVSMFLAGSFVIYAFGVAGLMINVGFGLNQAVLQGVAPFLLGDVIKATVAGSVLPSAWRLVGDPYSESR